MDRACTHLDETVSSLGPGTNDISREGGGYLNPDQRKWGYVDLLLRGLPWSTLPNYILWDFCPPSSPCMQILATLLTRSEHYVCILAYLTRFQCVNTKWKPLTISKPEGLFFCGHGRGRQSQRTESTLNSVPVSGRTRLWKSWFKSLSPSPRGFCGDRPAYMP